MEEENKQSESFLNGTALEFNKDLDVDRDKDKDKDKDRDRDLHIDIENNESNIGRYNIYNTNRKTVTVELHQYGVLFSYPGTKLIAKTHSKTFRMGEFEENYERKCECCNNKYPTRFYNCSHPIKSKEIMKYGIDLVNFFILLKHYFRYIVYFYLTYFIQTVICLAILGVPKVLFNYLYIELYYQTLLYNDSNSNRYKISIDHLFNLIRIALVLYVYIGIKTKIEKKFNQYKRKLLDDVYLEIDESVYAVFIKNLPKVIDKEDLISFLKSEYKVKSIRDVLLVRDVETICEKFEYLESKKELKKRMEVTNSDLKYELKDFEEVETMIKKANDKLKYLINEQEGDCFGGGNKLFSGTAIVIFEKNEEKNMFLRKNFQLGIYCIFNCNKPLTYNGKRIYFESIPPLDQIDWKYSKYSLEKYLSSNCMSTILSIIIFLLFSWLIFAITYFSSLLNSIFIFNYNIFKIPFVKALFLLFVNFILEKKITLCFSIFKISDKYFSYVLIRNFLMQKTYFNTIVINLILLQRNVSAGSLDSEQLNFLYFLLLITVKSIILTRFNGKYITAKMKFFFLTKILRRKLIQIDVNELYGDNEFDVIKTFENYRLLVFTALFLMKLYFICSCLLILLIFIHFHLIKLSLFHSCLKNINYLGYYFKIIIKNELVTLIIVIITLSYTTAYETDIKALVSNVIFIVSSDILYLINFKFGFNTYTVDKDYSEMCSKFKRRFKDEEFVNLNLIKTELELE